MNRGSTIFLRLALLAVAAIVLVLCVFAIPGIIQGWNKEYPHLSAFRYPIVVGLAISAVAFWAAVYQALKLLHYIDTKKVFSNRSVVAIRNIKYSALVVSAVYALGLPVSYQMAQAEDAPGLILICLIFSAVPLAIAVFLAVVGRLLQDAIKFKAENDLTV